MVGNFPDWARKAQAKWEYRGEKRPPFAREPQPGQESVWDYPRPPRLEVDSRRIEIFAYGKQVLKSHSAYRLLETASPPTFYFSPTDIIASVTLVHGRTSACEWKGIAEYWTLNLGPNRLEAVAWSYPKPFPGYETIAGHFSFYPNHVECFVNGERVKPQPGGLYGGWVTQDLKGPFKGEPGTEHW